MFVSAKPQCGPAMMAQCVVEPEVAMEIYFYASRPVGGTAQRRTPPKRKKTTPVNERESREACVEGGQGSGPQRSL